MDNKDRKKSIMVAMVDILTRVITLCQSAVTLFKENRQQRLWPIEKFEHCLFS